MDKKLYLECYSGINGNMLVGALLDLGADKDVLKKALASLPVEEFSVEIKKVKKFEMDMCEFTHTHPYEHKTLHNILHILEQGDITPAARKTAEKIFEILKDAETKENETETVNSVVEIISAAVCLDNLGITEIIIPVLYEGCGFVKNNSGIIPVPAPAVTQIAVKNNLNLHFTDIEGEFITLTGAAIAAGIKTSDKLPKNFTVEKVGVGTYKRDIEDEENLKPCFIRAMILKDTVSQKDFIYKLETNIDDCTGEMLGFVMERLFQTGARDVHYIPVFMKKNRPAYQLNVLCTEEDREKLEKIIFEETTTIGIRRVKMERTVLKRSIEKVHTPFGDADIKICDLENSRRAYPEYESVVSICREYGLPFQKVYKIIQDEYECKNEK